MFTIGETKDKAKEVSAMIAASLCILGGRPEVAPVFVAFAKLLGICGSELIKSSGSSSLRELKLELQTIHDRVDQYFNQRYQASVLKLWDDGDLRVLVGNILQNMPSVLDEKLVFDVYRESRDNETIGASFVRRLTHEAAAQLDTGIDATKIQQAKGCVVEMLGEIDSVSLPWHDADMRAKGRLWHIEDMIEEQQRDIKIALGSMQAIYREVTAVRDNEAERSGSFDIMVRFVEQTRNDLQEMSAKIAKEDESPAEICSKLARFLPKLVQAVYRQQGGIADENYPPAWLIACCNVAVRDIDEASKMKAPVVREIVHRHSTLLGQCFMVGYYAVCFRRPAVETAVDETADYDLKKIMEVFERIKMEASERHVHAWDVGVVWMSLLLDWLDNQRILPKCEEVEFLLFGAMYRGYNVGRAVEFVATEKRRVR